VLRKRAPRFESAIVLFGVGLRATGAADRTPHGLAARDEAPWQAVERAMMPAPRRRRREAWAAPHHGRRPVAGPCHGDGQILIIDHEGGYDSLIAGLERLDVSVGQWLTTGEPAGIMPKGEERPRLYLELHHGGQPINPLPWLATSNEKVSG